MGTNWTNVGRTIADLGTVTAATSITATDLIGTNVDGIIGADTARDGTFTAVIGTTGVYSGILKTDDATDATTTTNGSLQTDGGLSVVKDIIAGNDVYLLNDSAVLGLGLGKDATLTHDGTTGLTIAATPISINSTGDLTLDSSTDIVLDCGGADIFLKDDGVKFGTFTNDLGLKIATEAAGALVLSGNLSIDFSDRNIEGTLLTGGKLSLSKGSVDWTDFVTNFGAGTSLMGALSMAKTGSTGGGATRAKVVCSVSAATGAYSEIDLNTLVIAGGNKTLDYTDVSYDPDRIDVFVNGVMLMSGTEGSIKTANADYTIDATRFAITAPTASIRFGFGLSIGDTIVVAQQ